MPTKPKLDTSTPATAEPYLLDHSGLPGPRANLELASTLAKQAADFLENPTWYARLLDWATTPPEQIDTNHPRVFLTFAAIQTLGAAFTSATPACRATIKSVLNQAANDPRWRVREACAIALQEIGMQSSEELLAILRAWMAAPSLLELRAALAALAHPPILNDEHIANYFFDTAGAAYSRWESLSPMEAKSESAKTLRKALEYAPSVLVAAHPTRGFQMLEDWANTERVDMAKIVAANLRKARLARRYPDQVESVALRLE
ncbi:MAG: hypothetical protein FWD57_07450, partial [Polyangiaceae bacterium]|nr:hypothetical protein [Polyangiaceae bacterium]